MVTRGEVAWAPDPFKEGAENPRPWLAIAADALPYPDDESIGVACTTQSHHPGTFQISSAAWRRGEPDARSYVLPWAVATLKDELHVVGVQGEVTPEFTERVTDATIGYLCDTPTHE